MKSIYRFFKVIILIFTFPLSFSSAQQTNLNILESTPLIYYFNLIPDSFIEKKFVLNAVNEGVAARKFKSMGINIEWNKQRGTYEALIESRRNFHFYLEIRDRDENVIYFREIFIARGVNAIPIVTEDNNQNLFTLSFQNFRNAKPANFVMKEHEVLRETNR